MYDGTLFPNEHTSTLLTTPPSNFVSILVSFNALVMMMLLGYYTKNWLLKFEPQSLVANVSNIRTYGLCGFTKLQSFVKNGNKATALLSNLCSVFSIRWKDESQWWTTFPWRHGGWSCSMNTTYQRRWWLCAPSAKVELKWDGQEREINRFSAAPSPQLMPIWP